MNSSPNCPNDAKWLRRWIRSNAVCFLAMLTFLLILKFQHHPSAEEQARAAGSVSAESLGESMIHSARPESAEMPTRVEFAERPEQAGGPVSIAPSGWRRTDRGWENVASWQKTSPPLGEIVLRQQMREPKWARESLATLRGLPPLAFAMLQIAAISAIVALSRQKREASTPTAAR